MKVDIQIKGLGIVQRDSDKCLATLTRPDRCLPFTDKIIIFSELIITFVNLNFERLLSITAILISLGYFDR